MINYIWSFMIIAGILYGGLTGNMEAITNAALDSSEDAITLCITMVGVMGLWMGLMEIAKNAGLIRALTQLIQPVIRFLFPDIPIDHPAADLISTNFIANVLGLGWAATPAGLEAMKALESLEEDRRHHLVPYNKTVQEKGVANNEMCTFLILNISSLQLIPMTIIAYRSEYGSSNPSAIILPCIIATICSTAVAIAFCKYKQLRS